MVFYAGILALILSSCLSSPSVPELRLSEEVSAPLTELEWLVDTRPSGDTLVFVASGPRHSDRNIEKVSALKDAAMQAGIFSGFWGSSQDFILSSQRGANLVQRTRADYDGRAEDRAFEQMKAVKEWATKEGTWIKFQLKLHDIPILNWQPEYLNSQPMWINNPPEISGWHVAVGLGDHQSTLAKALRKADEVALADIIHQIHGASQTVHIENSRSSSSEANTQVATASYGRGFGIVRGFLVISRWYNASGAWSLAVCPRSWNSG